MVASFLAWLEKLSAFQVGRLVCFVPCSRSNRHKQDEVDSDIDNSGNDSRCTNWICCKLFTSMVTYPRYVVSAS